MKGDIFMAIRNDFLNCCETCEYLDPVITRLYGNGDIIENIISCDNKARCESIYKNIYEHIKNEIYSQLVEKGDKK